MSTDPAAEADDGAEDALDAARDEIAGRRAAPDDAPAGSAQTHDGEDAPPPTDS